MRVRRSALIAATAVAAVAGSGVAAAARIDVVHALRLTSGHPGTSSGLYLHVSQKPTKAGEQPPVVRKLKVVLPKGARLDTLALPRCTATDAELQAGGTKACPAKTKLGGGSARVFLGATTITADVTLFNRRTGFVFLLTSGKAVLRVIPAKASGRTVRVTLPKVPLAGGKEASFVRLKILVPKHRTGKHVWLRAPATCPKSRRWTSMYLPTFDPPHGTEHIPAKTVCRR